MSEKKMIASVSSLCEHKEREKDIHIAERETLYDNNTMMMMMMMIIGRCSEETIVST
jgi:hypothetical protein